MHILHKLCKTFPVHVGCLNLLSYIRICKYIHGCVSMCICMIVCMSHLHHAEPGLLRGRPFSMEWSPTGLPSFPRVFSQKFLQQLKQHYSAALGLGAFLSS